MSKDIVEIKFKCVLGGICPTKAHGTDAAWDIYAPWKNCLGSLDSAIISTGVMVAIPPGYYGQIMGRSGMAVGGILVHPGIIDSGYRGEISIILHHLNRYEHQIKPGDRIAQLLILPVPEVKWVEVDHLDETDRGTNGFGSTGR